MLFVVHVQYAFSLLALSGGGFCVAADVLNLIVSQQRNLLYDIVRGISDWISFRLSSMETK